MAFPTCEIAYGVIIIIHNFVITSISELWCKPECYIINISSRNPYNFIMGTTNYGDFSPPVRDILKHTRIISCIVSLFSLFNLNVGIKGILSRCLNTKPKTELSSSFRSSERKLFSGIYCIKVLYLRSITTISKGVNIAIFICGAGYIPRYCILCIWLCGYIEIVGAIDSKAIITSCL